MNAIDLIKLHEGKRLDLYKCPADKWTIGYGHNLEDNGITEAIADALLAEDIRDSESYLKQYFWFTDLDHNRKAALTDMMYNMGPKTFSHFDHMIEALGEGDFERAADEAMDSKWYKQVKGRGETIVRILRTGA